MSPLSKKSNLCVLIFISVIFSCRHSIKQLSSRTIVHRPLTVRSLISSNAYIDDYLAFDSAYVNHFDELPDSEQVKAKACLYRFYKHITIIKGCYVCNLSAAKQINVSDQIFRALTRDLHHFNMEMAKARKKGKLDVYQLDGHYFESLLD